MDFSQVVGHPRSSQQDTVRMYVCIYMYVCMYMYVCILDIEMNEYIHIRQLKVHAQALKAPSQIHCNDTKLFNQSKICSISILFLLYIRLRLVSKDVLCMQLVPFMRSVGKK